MRIFITIDSKRIFSDVILDDINEKTEKGISKLTEHNPILYFNDNSKDFECEKNLDSTIILILDQTYTNSISHFNINEKEDYLLHHSQPAGLAYLEFVNKENGQHEKHDKKYPAAFQIIFDEDDNKAERIIQQIFAPVTTSDGITVTETQAEEAFKLILRDIDLLEVMIENNENKEQQNTIIDKLKNNTKIVSDYLENYPKQLNSVVNENDVNIKELRDIFKTVHDSLGRFFDIKPNP